MNFDDMRKFERHYEAWLEGKIAYCEEPNAVTGAAADAAAGSVIDCIKSDWPTEKA
jgi:hypothetical protein